MLRDLLTRFTARPGMVADLPRSETPICLIGDIHGRADLLEAMFARIENEAGAAQVRIVTLGDMIDRGPESARVLRLLHAAQRANPQRVTCLMGNHERMMLDFLIAPDSHSVRWLRTGGEATLRSLGVTPPDPTRPDPDALDALRMELAHALGPDLLDWLDRLPLWWREGRLAAAHAGADPSHPIERQSSDALLWGHPRFGNIPRRDGVWIAHGHWIVDSAFVEDGRIALDTGAFQSGRLSAAWIDRRGLRLFEVRS